MHRKLGLRGKVRISSEHPRRVATTLRDCKETVRGGLAAPAGKKGLEGALLEPGIDKFSGLRRKTSISGPRSPQHRWDTVTVNGLSGVGLCSTEE